MALAYNPRHWLDSMIVFGPVNGGMLTTKLFTEALRYDSSGQIIQQQSEHYGSARRTVDYGYDKANRPTVWGSGDDTTTYSYDAVGNRTDQFVWASGAIQSSTNYAIGGLGPNQLTSLQKYSGGGTPINGPTSYGYDADGAVNSRTAMISGGGGGGMTPRTETFAYSWRDLLRRYTTPTNSPTPVTDWRYRYSAGGEREQKRMYTWRQLNDTLFHTRAWVYYALGGGKEQLAVYHGLEVAFDNPDVLCEGPSDDRVYFYPVEYNTFGGGISRITTRPNALSSAGIKEYKIADHLGSTRLGIDAVTGVTRTVDYEPFGTAVTGLGGAGTPRQSFIDKEMDYENGYGDFGVRRFEEETGRFLSVEPKWEQFPDVSPYGYAGNTPISAIDRTGLDIVILNDEDGAQGAGHMAVIVGNDRDGWVYYSKDGPGEGNKRKSYGTLDQFLKDEETSGRYHRRARFSVTPAQDASAKKRGDEIYGQPYRVTDNNCATLAVRVASAGGVIPAVKRFANVRARGSSASGGTPALSCAA